MRCTGDGLPFKQPTKVGFILKNKTMINYSWALGPFECKRNADGLEKIVHIIHWRYRGVDQDGISSEVYGTQHLDSPNPENFIPFDELPKEQVEGWLESKLNMDYFKTRIEDAINLIKNPITEILPAPWNTVSTLPEV